MVARSKYESTKKRILFSCLSIPFLVCIGGFIATITAYTHINLWAVLTLETLSGTDFNYDALQMAEILIGIPIGGIGGIVSIAIIGHFIKVNNWLEIVVYLILGMIFGGLGGLIFGWATLGFMTVGSS